MENNTELKAFNELLNTPPPLEEVKKDDSTGVEFLEISYIEDKLRELYLGMVEYNVLEWRQALNEVTAHVRLTVTHPINGRILSYDGLASTEVTTLNKFVCVERANKYKLEIMEAPSLKLDLAKVYSLAIKNAAKKIGRAFGSDLNRHSENETFIDTEAKTISKEEQKKNSSENAISIYKDLNAKKEEGK